MNDRALIVTRNLPPLIGGMERLNWHIVDELRKRHAVRVVAPDGSARLAPPGVELLEAPLSPVWWFLIVALWRALHQALAWKPSIIVAGSGLMAPIVWIAARLCGARSAAYVHGLDISVPHPIYRMLWLPFIRRMDVLIANSRATAGLAIAAGCPEERITVICPGVSISTSIRDEGAIAAFRQRCGLEDKRILLSVGRFTRRKGLREFIAQALPQIVEVHPGTRLVVVGDVPSNALHAAGQDMSSLVAAASAAGVAEHVQFVGRLSESDLLLAYQAADVHVFPVRHIPGDPEGFGMVAIEAAAHDLPTVAFATGGIPDAVAEGKSGRLIAPGDYAGFSAAVVAVLADGSPLRQTARAFAEEFAWPRFGERLERILGGRSPS